MTETRRYYSDKGLTATVYDVVTALDPTLAGDIDLYAGLAPAGGHILELGAGTGRVSIALAEKGFRVTGYRLELVGYFDDGPSREGLAQA